MASDMKTSETDEDPRAYLARVENRGRAEDAATVMEIMARVTGQPPRMWGPSIIGFGAYDYTRADGSEHRSLRTGLSPRKANLTIYLMPGCNKYAEILARLGKHKQSVSCLYVGRLKNIDLEVLEEVIRASVVDMDQMYPR